MLGTLLEIGRILRTQEKQRGLRHHRYIKPAPLEVDRHPVRFFRVPVAPDGSFEFGRPEEMIDENAKARCFYLNYKAGEADSSKPYVFGDILRTFIVKGKAESETGNFKLANPQKKSWSALSSFTRFEKPAPEGEASKPQGPQVLTPLILAFRRSFRAQQIEIEAFIAQTPLVYLHFGFDGRGWHQLDEQMAAVQAMILGNFVQESPQGIVLKAFLFKTIASGGSSTPGFWSENAHKVRRFESPEQVEDLIYALNYAGRAAVRERDIKIIVLPRGEGLTAQQIERFFDKTGLKENEDSEEDIKSNAKSEMAAKAGDEEPLFSIVPEDDEADTNLLQFDFIFSLAGGAKPDVDLIEVSGLERSRLAEISRRVRAIREDIAAQRQVFLNTSKPIAAPTITRSFLSILGDATKAKKKYQSHLLKVLPQIYTESYVRDPVLLPALIEKTEANIRSDAANFNLLKWDFHFLTRLQNTTTEGERLMEIQNSSSYRIGLLLGKLAKQFAGSNSPIKSFEKNYVGLLSRRIATLPDAVRLANEINQKLVIHELSGFTFRISTELAEEIKKFESHQERYDKDKCAFGFFESYFAPIKARAKDTDPDASPWGADAPNPSTSGDDEDVPVQLTLDA